MCVFFSQSLATLPDLILLQNTSVNCECKILLAPVMKDHPDLRPLS